MSTQKINGVYHVSNTEQGGGGGSDPNAVKYTPQTLTTSQQAQARLNIGAGTSDFSGDPIVSVTVPDPYDGTLIFTKSSGDTVTVDLNHNHPQYPRYELCEDEAEYQAIVTKEDDTLYLIPETSS